MESNVRKYNADLVGCKGVQHFRFDSGLEFFKYLVLVAGHKPPKKEASKTHLYGL